MVRAGRVLSVMGGFRRFIGLSVPHRTLYFRTPSQCVDSRAQCIDSCAQGVDSRPQCVDSCAQGVTIPEKCAIIGIAVRWRERVAETQLKEDER